MPDIHSHFTKYHASQYTNHATDVRFLDEQHFKIVTVYMVITGFIGNVAASHRSLLLGAFGFIFSYLCLFWDKRTTQWWGVLFDNLKQLEQLAHSDGKMIESSRNIRGGPPVFLSGLPLLQRQYYLGFAGWTIFLVYSWPVWWS